MEKITQQNQTQFLELDVQEFISWRKTKELLEERKAFNMLVRFPEVYARGEGSFIGTIVGKTKRWVREHLRQHKKDISFAMIMRRKNEADARKFANKEKLMDRIAQVNLLRQEKKTLDEIGAVIGVTSERIRQIAHHPANPRKDIWVKGIREGKCKTRPKIELVCIGCRGVRVARVGQIVHPDRWAHVECRVPKTKEQLLERERELARLRYQKPEKKARQALAMHKQYLKKKADPVRWAAHKEKERVYLKKYWADMKIHRPEKYNEKIRKMAEYSKQRDAKLRLNTGEIDL